MSRDGESEFRTVILPFIIFTAIWGSTWIVIRGQLGIVPPQWSVAYRFVIAAAAMALVATWRGESLRIGRKGLLAALFLGLTQFCVNFDAVYLAERHITSGVVATVFALLVIPSSLLAWAFLGHRPTARCGARRSRSPESRCCSFTSCARTAPAPGRSLRGSG
jgi:drug/metabolite transporter (DMT)-like permease